VISAATGPGPVSPPNHRPIHFVLPHLLDTVRSTLIVIIAALFIIGFVAQPFRIPSESMERTLLVGDFLLVDKVAFAPPGIWKRLLPYRNIAQRDIVVFHFPLDSEEHVVKRVIGIPGDEVTLNRGVAVVNNTLRAEPYDVFENADQDEYRDQFPRYTTEDPSVDPHWQRQMHTLIDNAHLRVPAGSYFVLGDNRNHSRDSRYWGFVPRENIEGTPLLIYFSLRQPSATDTQPAPGGRLGNSVGDGLAGFARWDRILRIIH
jgi:signal peptidase I